MTSVQVDKPWPTAPHFVYVLSDVAGTCLYIGVTMKIGQRLLQHQYSKTWWPQVVHIEVTWYADLASGCAAEREAIKTANPVHNKVHTDHPPENGWTTRRAMEDLRHERGETCQPWKKCKRCNSMRKQKQLVNA